MGRAAAKKAAAARAFPAAPAPPPRASAEDVPECLLWKCPICLDTLAEPVLTTCCGQSFCRECLDEALRKVDACPMCRAPLLSGAHSMTRNRALEELLARMTVSDASARGDGAAEREVLITIRDVASENEPREDEEAKRHTTTILQRIRGKTRCLVGQLGGVLAMSRSALQLQQWRHWCRIHWASLQCVFYVCLFGLFVFFLRVQEEKFAEHDTRGHRR